MYAIIKRLNAVGSLFVNFSFDMLIQASILILILLALDFLLRKKVRAIFRYCVWLLVLVKLIIPTSISSPVSIGGLFGDKLSEIKIVQTESPGQIEQAGTAIKVPALAVTEPKPELYKEIDPAGTHLRSLEWQKEQAKVIETSTGEVEKQQKPAAASISVTWQGTVFMTWAIAVLILILLLILRAIFVRGLVVQADEITGGLNDLVRSCGKLVGMKQKVRLRTSPNATSPAVCGLFRPVILLPQNLAPSLTKEQLKAVLVHELIHIKRGDLWINLFQSLLQIAYFYNPLVWLANAIIKRAREQAVDEAVQVALGKSAESYPQILVDVAKLAFKRPALGLRLIGVVENKSALKDRIARMLSRPMPRKAKLGFVGFISVFIVAAILLPMAAGRNEENITEPDTPKFEATLSNGVTVELVGTCQYTEDGVNCYRPDGLPLGKSLKISKWNQKPKAGDTGIMLKVTGPEDFSFSYDKILGAKGWEGSCQVIDENGEKLEGYEAALTRFDDKQLTTELKFGAVAGAWKTVAEHDGRSIKIVNGVSFTKAAETEQGVQIFTTDTIGRNVTQRIVAIDNNGRLYPWRGHTGSVSNSQIRQSIGTFPDLKLEQIEKFQFQTRPYEWVEFKNVSVKPDFKTDVQIGTEGKGNEQPLGTLITPGQGVGGLTFGMSKDDVIERLGEPKSLINRREGYSLYYDGICFNIIDNKVNTIDVLSPYYKFENGLGIGDSELKIIQTFGSDFYLDKREGKDFLTYKNKGLIFEIFKNKRTVMEITVMKAENNYRSKFLETIPEFRDLHLGMTEREFQNQIKQFPVYVNRTEQEDGHIRYHLFAKNGENIIVGFSNGVCGGIQRMMPIPILGADNEWEQAVEDSANLEYSDVNIGVWGWTHKDEGWKGNIKSITAIEVENPAGQNENSNMVNASTQKDLQSLIDSARIGGTITIPKGLYTEPIVINKSLRLKGEDANDCIIEVTADEPAIFVDTKGKGLVTIENLAIKWQLATSDKDIEYPIALVVKDSRAQIKNCNFVPLGNFRRSPFAVRAMGFTNLNIDNCRFEGFEYTIQFGEGTEGILQNSVITNCGHQGVINYSGSTLRVKGNIITGSKFHAVRCTGGKLYVEDNLLINNENRGIYLGGKSASGTITNNVIMGNGTNISGFARSQVSITNNIIADSSYAGISMRDSCRLLIADNIFLKNGRGIILHEEAGKNSNRISKNTFWKNTVNFENIEQFAPPIEAEPGLVDPNNGDFSLRSGPVREQNQGLKKPEVFKALWGKFKRLEVAESDF